MRGWVLAAAVASVIVVLPASAATADKIVVALVDEAAALQAKGDRVAALVKAREAVALAERAPGKNNATLYIAVNALIGHLPDGDTAGQFAAIDRLVPLAIQVKGPQSYEAQSADATRSLIGLFLGKPGIGLETVAVPLARAAALAADEKDRIDTATLALVLARIYENAGQRAKALEMAAVGAKLYVVAPDTYNRTWTGGLTTLGQLYGAWRQWDLALATADRAIAAIVGYTGKRGVDIGPPLIIRAVALINLKRPNEAESAYREAIAVSDVDGSVYFRATAMLNLATFYSGSGRDALAEKLLSSAAEQSVNFPAGSATRSSALLELSHIASRKGAFQEALRYARLGRDDMEKRSFKGGAAHATLLLTLVAAALETGDIEEARTTLDQIDGVLPKAAGPISISMAEAAALRGKLAFVTGDLATSASKLHEARALYEKLAAAEPFATASARARIDVVLADVLDRQGNAREAWRMNRTGVDTVIGQIVRRATLSDTTPLDVTEMRTFDGALSRAWKFRKG